MLLLTQSLLAVGISLLPGQPSQLARCPTGEWVEPGQPCPRIGPHPTYVFFGLDEVTLNERARISLYFAAENVRRSGIDTIILVEGHADRSGSAAYNLQLSKRRAEVVRNYLATLGLAPNGIGIAYFGEERPHQETADGVPEADNRRAVVWVVQEERFLDRPHPQPAPK
jgi:outer membrane protein OmpA-like peptidoglycan-associated protein